MPRVEYEQELNELEMLLIKMSTQVEEMMDMTIRSVMNQDLELANKVIKKDIKVDNLEISIEKKCILVIAKQSPIASDLRKISAILKIITDLERIGDHCVNIAKIVIKIGKTPYVKPLIDIPKMADMVKLMVKDGLNSYVRLDADQAIEVAQRDDEVDKLYDIITVDLLTLLGNDQQKMTQVVDLLFIGRYLERIADHATNICERIIFMVTGDRKYF